MGAEVERNVVQEVWGHSTPDADNYMAIRQSQIDANWVLVNINYFYDVYDKYYMAQSYMYSYILVVIIYTHAVSNGNTPLYITALWTSKLYSLGDT